MSKQAQALTSLLLVATCTAMLVQSGLAQLPAAPIQPRNLTDILQCWSALTNIEGCVEEIFRSISSGLIGHVGPACCKAFVTIDADCWPKMFPVDPFFPPLLKDKCAAQEPTAPAPAPTAQEPTAPAPTAPSPTASSPTAQEPTASAPTAQEPIAPAPTAPSPTAQEPTVPALIAPAPTVF